MLPFILRLPEKPVWPILRKAIYRAVIVTCCAITGCTPETSAEAFQDVPVLTGYLLPGSRASVTIERKQPFNEDAVLSDEQIDSLSVTLYVDGIPYPLYSIGGGVYSDTSDAVVLEAGQLFSLQFQFNGKEVTAETTILNKPSGFTQSVTTLAVESFSAGGGPGSGGGLPNIPDPVTLSWNNDDRTYYLVVVENIESNPTLIKDTTGQADRPQRVFRNEPTQGNEYEINAMAFEYYGRHRIILYHLNPDYAALYNDSGSSSQNLTTPVSNVVNGLGIFTGINADTLILRVVKP